MVGYELTLIDGDIVAYRAAASKVGDSRRPCREPEAISKADEIIDYILTECSFYNPTKKYKVCLTGKGNFRNEIAKTKIYKGNRTDAVKPDHLSAVRSHLLTKYKAALSSGEEADDLISKTAAANDYRCIIASTDKDMLQIPGMHFNFVKGDFFKIDEEDGLQFFYRQILTGDSADNIEGLYQVGPVKAEKMLNGCRTEDDLWKAVVKAYDGNADRVVENARLLWLRRSEGELWQPPGMRKQKVD